MGARPYAPVLGRFLELDPIPGGATDSDYSYVDDPINAFDLNGQNKCEVGANPLRWIGNAVDCASKVGRRSGNGLSGVWKNLKKYANASSCRALNVNDSKCGSSSRRAESTNRAVKVAVCSASRTPIVGSVIPEFSKKGAASFVAENWADPIVGQLTDSVGGRAGSVMGAATSVLAQTAYIATAIDATCRWG